MHAGRTSIVRVYWGQCMLHYFVVLLALFELSLANPCNPQAAVQAPRCEDPPGLPSDLQGVVPPLFTCGSPTGQGNERATSSQPKPPAKKTKKRKHPDEPRTFTGELSYGSSGDLIWGRLEGVGLGLFGGNLV